MIVQSRIALGLAVLALLGGLAAIYVPAVQLTAEIDRALSQEDDALADALKDRLLVKAEENVEALEILVEAEGLEGLKRHGQPMRVALRASAILLTDGRGNPLETYATIDTPSGLARTPSVRAMAKKAAATSRHSISRGFLLVYGQTYVAAAMPLDKDPTRPEGAVALVFTRIEHGVMAQLSREYGLAELDLTQDAPDDGAPAVPLTDPNGRVTGYLTWENSHPTQKLLEELGPWVVGVVLAVAIVLTVLAAMTFRAYRRASSAALANQVLERADRAKSLLFANLSHEFRTPLNAVIGFSDLMQRETFGPLGHPKYAEYIGDIHSSASHLLGLIEDVLVLSRYEAAEGVTLNDSVNLQDVIDETCRMLDYQAAKKGLKLSADRMPPIQVLGTEKALRQVAINLIGNAIKYTERGAVHVSAAPTADGTGVDLIIADTGIGIPEEHMDRIMRPFEQVNDVYARRQGGTGLGLSIVTSILAHAGGSMRLESRPGRGTRVTVTLRRAATLPHGHLPQQKAA